MSTVLGAVGMTSLARDIPLLTLLVLVPLFGALVLWAIPQRWERVVRLKMIAISGIEAALGVFLLLAFNRNNGEYQFVSRHQWFADFGVQWKLGVDGISLFLVVLTTLVIPLVLVGLGTHSERRSYAALIFLLQAGLIGAFLALDVFLFFVCFEFVLIPMYFLILGWGYEHRGRAALKFFLYTFFGSTFFFVGMIVLAVITAARGNVPVTFDLITLQQAQALTAGQQHWIFLAFVLAFAVKMPIVPLHTWVGDTYRHAPFAVVVLSSAVVVKLGAYGLIRFCVELFPDSASKYAPVMLTFGVVSMIYGAIIAIGQTDLRRLMAYSSVSHLGFVTVGAFAFQNIALSGAVFQMISHGLIASALLLLVAFLFRRTETTEIAHMQGLQAKVPVLAAMLMIALLASAGVPLLSGFVAEFMVLLGTFSQHRWWAVAGTGALVLGVIYLLWAYQRVFHGPTSDDLSVSDIGWRERLVIAPLLLGIVALGVYPNLALDRISPTVDRITKSHASYETSTNTSIPNMTQSWQRTEGEK